MATFGIVEILKRELAAVGCPASTVASLAGVSPSKLSAFLNGVISHVPNDDEVKLYQAWTELKKLASYASPLELNFRKVDSLRRCIAMMRAQTLQIVVYENRDETESEEPRNEQ